MTEARGRDWLHRLRLLWFGIAICVVFTVLAGDRFASSGNVGNIVRATTTDALPAVGFTAVMLAGQLDLSIGAVMCTGGVAAISLQEQLGWFGSVSVALLAGALIGLVNGLLVARCKVNSFIATLGTMTILTGLCRALLEGGSRSVADVATGMHMVEILGPVAPWSPRILLVMLPVLLVELALRQTRFGMHLYLLGASRETARNAGVPVDRYVTGVFVLSGALSALGGALTAMAQNTVMPNLGEKSLMLVVAAVIAAGTAMSGGRGSPLLSVAALLLLNTLSNGLSYVGASRSAKLVAYGAVLAGIIVYDAWRQARRERVRGQRKELLQDLEGRPDLLDDEELDDEQVQGSEEMPRKQTDRSLAIVSVAAVACVAIVAIYAMWSKSRMPAPTNAPAVASTPTPTGPAGAAAEEPAAAMSSLLATDGQPLIYIDDSPLNPPARPTDPEALPDDDPLRWYDYEYAGWTGEKLPMPESPGDGPSGKRVVSLQYMDHPYFTGYGNGMKRAAEYYGIELTTMEAGNDNKVQMDNVEQAIAMKPDLVILNPVDSNGVVPMLKRLYDAGIPTITSNLLPVDEGMKYCLCWTGPDDWGQFRMLAREFAKLMGNNGDYVVVRHVAGTSCYLSRTWGAVSELKRIAPGMKCLDMQTTDLQSEKTKTQVASWLEQYGDDLKGIISADDSKAQVGIAEALEDAGRTDVVCVAAGSSRTGLNLIKEGKLQAVTYQSAEGDGALPIEIAARWFRGKPIDRSVYYLKKHIITQQDVDDFLPAQW